MNVLGLFDITRSKAKPPAGATPPTSLAAVNRPSAWFSLIRESFAGAWQQNVEITSESVLTYAAVWACVRLMAHDISKMRIKLMQVDADGIWTETSNAAFSPVLRKPNRYQTRIKFLEQWQISKLLHGNTYVLKERDARGVVRAMYVLDPTRVTPLVGPDGSVWYRLQTDALNTLATAVTAPAREIIHDVMVPLYHPLCGVSPLAACGLAASQGLRIQQNSSYFFANGSHPGGVLEAPATVPQETIDRLKIDWQENFSGNNAGKVAILGDGMTYKPLAMSATDAQLIEQLKWTAENVCTAFGVPPYKVGVSPAPTYNNVEALNVDYYSQTLQNPIECVEILLDEGLELPPPYGTELDLDDLYRMDTSTATKAAKDAIGSGAMTPNEARRKYFGLGAVPGGGSPYLQEQNYSLAALAKRDAQPDPFASSSSAPPPAEDETDDDDETDSDDLADDDVERAIQDMFRKTCVPCL